MDHERIEDINFQDKWAKLDKDIIKSEEIKRPSLTYWRDAFRRLKQNKLSMISLIFLIILIIVVIVLPMRWKYTYEEQHLDYKMIKPYIDVYDIGDGDYVHVTNDHKVISVSKDGKLLGAPDLIRNNMMGREAIYEDINGKSIVVDYGVLIRAKKALRIEARNDPTIDYEAEEKKLEETINPVRLLVNDVEMKDYKTVKNTSYLLGTDSLGRDLFIRTIYGGRISLLIAFFAATINFVIGVTYGGISGFFGGKVDNVMMRIVDTISTIPLILYVIVLMVVLTPSLSTIIIALSLTYWVGMARIVRGQVLSLKEQEFVLAAKTIGAKTPRVLFRHIIPNTMGPIMVALTMQIPAAIFTEAFLSFIGLGVPEPIPSWGTLANNALRGFTIYPYLLLWPALLLSVTLLAFNLLGDGLRDALDPRLRK
ncbi:ABC transporter permease [Mycoplasmatota bacterium]|nr:ABC transporter permease [Mycoplasmatota bacterium]